MPDTSPNERYIVQCTVTRIYEGADRYSYRAEMVLLERKHDGFVVSLVDTNKSWVEGTVSRALRGLLKIAEKEESYGAQSYND